MSDDLILRLLEERDLYRDALNCKRCGGTGNDCPPDYNECPDCADARERARGK